MSYVSQLPAPWASWPAICDPTLYAAPLSAGALPYTQRCSIARSKEGRSGAARVHPSKRVGPKTRTGQRGSLRPGRAIRQSGPTVRPADCLHGNTRRSGPRKRMKTERWTGRPKTARSGCPSKASDGRLNERLHAIEAMKSPSPTRTEARYALMAGIRPMRITSTAGNNGAPSSFPKHERRSQNLEVAASQVRRVRAP